VGKSYYTDTAPFRQGDPVRYWGLVETIPIKDGASRGYIWYPETVCTGAYHRLVKRVTF